MNDAPLSRYGGYTLAEEQIAVTKGARLLDRILPGWYKQVTLQTLKMSSGTHCMLGQLFGIGVESKLAETMYPDELNTARDAHPLTAHNGYHVARGVMNRNGCLPAITKKLEIQNSMASEIAALEHVCIGHDNKCLWAEAIAERMANDAPADDNTNA